MQRYFSKWVKPYIAALALLLLPSAGYCATINLVAGDNLNLAVEMAAPGDTILLGPGTYTPQSTPYLAGANLAQAFWISKKVTVRGTAGAAATILSSDGAYDYAVQFRPVNYRLNGIANISDPSGAVLDGVTVNSQRGGIAVFDPEGEVVGGVSDVQIRNVVINADGNGINEEHALLLQLVQKNVIDNVVVNKGAASAFYILGGSKNTIINSRSNFVRMNHPIVVQKQYLRANS